MPRTKGAANKKTGILRNELRPQYKCSEGYNKTLDALKRAYPNKTYPDLLHEMMRDFAYKNLSSKTDLYWIKKIM